MNYEKKNISMRFIHTHFYNLLELLRFLSINKLFHIDVTVFSLI